MANGDFIELKQQPNTVGPFSKSFKLLDNQISSGSGPWVDSSVVKYGSVEVFGTFDGSVQLYGTNQNDPASDYAGQAIDSAITEAGLESIALPFRWIRAAATLSSGSVSAYFYGVA